MLESNLDMKIKLYRMSFKLIIILIYNSIILVFFLFVFKLKSDGTPGFSISDETRLLITNPKVLMIIVYNVLIGMIISAVMRIARNSMDLFKKSPFEKLSVLLCFEITKILANTALKSFSKRKQTIIRKLKNIIKKTFGNPKIMDFSVSSSIIITLNFPNKPMKYHVVIGFYDETREIININPITLFFKDRRMERAYEFYHKSLSIKYSKTLVIVYILAMSAYLVKNLVKSQDLNYLIYTEIALLIFGCLIFLLMRSSHYEKTYHRSTNLIVAAVILVKVFFDWSFSGIDITLSAVIGLLCSTLSIHMKINFTHIFCFNLGFLTSFILKVLLQFRDIGSEKFLDYPDFAAADLETIEYSVTISLLMTVLFVWFFSLITCYNDERTKRLEFLLKNRIEAESKLVKNIFSMLLPKFVEKAIGDQKNIAFNEKFKVSVLFCDIANFDDILAVERENTLKILDSIYRFFDDLCFSFAIQKIETVGKTYMACAGIPVAELEFPPQVRTFNKTTRLVNMAFEMLKFIDKFRTSRSLPVKLRIGIHEGEVIAGLVGQHKPQFSLIGDTVNTTSRICANGKLGHVTISEEARNELDLLSFALKGREVEAKGKGTLRVFEVWKRLALDEAKGLKRVVERVLKKVRERRRTANFNKIIDSLKRGSEMEVPQRWETTTESRLQCHMSGRNIKTRIFEHMREIREYLTGFWRLPRYILKQWDRYLEERKGRSSRKVLPKSQIINFKAEPRASVAEKPSKLIEAFTMKNETLYGNEEFLKQLALKNWKVERKILLVFFLVMFIRVFLLLSLMNFFTRKYFFMFECFFLIIYAIVIFFLREFYSNASKICYYKYLMISVYYLGVAMSFIEALEAKIKEVPCISMLTMAILHLVVTTVCFFTFYETLVKTIMLMVIWLALLAVLGKFTIENVIYCAAFLVLNLVKTWLKKQTMLRSFKKLKKNEYKREKQEIFVSHLLPLHTFEKLKQIENNQKIELSDSFRQVTLLFADIVNFTKYSAQVGSPAEVVRMLRSLFEEFDKECRKHQVYKVYTIGDCYVVMGVLNAFNRNPRREARNVVDMAMSMIRIIREVRTRVNFLDLDMRIGIHTGDVIGGIVGKDIIRYDIYGTDVLVANKMESNGVSGNILISQATKKILEEDPMFNHTFLKHSEVNIKILEKPIQTYFIKNLQEFLSL